MPSRSRDKGLRVKVHEPASTYQLGHSSSPHFVRVGRWKTRAHRALHKVVHATMRSPRALLALAAIFVLAPPALALDCSRPASWSVDGVRPMEQLRGNVTLVALLKAS
ncbi:uncharacterized protein LOC124263925 isoform X2 [Haliotis rubra]|uniref:uncharacterized protein LOC124263925 isoform X2 n=1 Tax=Haliotis rubra TaxID=36100 RepID=UPI001EE623C5|nr:uncharacterized protein LOC124263925 isoform X2 [Haliotis rubra]